MPLDRELPGRLMTSGLPSARARSSIISQDQLVPFGEPGAVPAQDLNFTFTSVDASLTFPDMDATTFPAIESLWGMRPSTKSRPFRALASMSLLLFFSNYYF